MKRRSIFADKLETFSDFYFGDDATARHRGHWRDFFHDRLKQSRESNSPPLAGRAGGGGERQAICGRPLILELGCYNAEFLSRIAQKHPDTNFVGLDWKARPLYVGARQIASQTLKNVALLRARAQDLTNMFADGELDEIWLLHPEPCDREKERRNRLMSEPFLFNVHRVLRDSASLILKTDHAEYFESTLQLLKLESITSRCENVTQSTDLWNDDAGLKSVSGKCFSGQQTFYEMRFTRKRLPIYYIELRRR